MALADDLSETLIALFAREGYRRVEPPVLQPAEIFLDLSGEDLRRRIFLTQDAAGTSLCLRPEYTIPVCRWHLAERGSIPATYSYAGPVFRQRAGESGEFRHAGIESIGRSDIAAADAETLGLTLEGLAALGLSAPRVTLGDVGLLEALLDRLSLAGGAKRRGMRAIVSGAGLPPAESGQAGENGDHAGLLGAIEGQDPKAVRAFVEDVLAIAGISTVGGRSAGEIAERFLARANRAGDLPAATRAALSRYLSIAGDPDSAALAIRTLARDLGLDLAEPLDLFEQRTGFLAARGVDVERLVFKAAFARNLDYYTGFIFEAYDPTRVDAKPVAGGGRYDRLLSHLGAPEPIPAVGVSLWLDRIDAVRGAEARS